MSGNELYIEIRTGVSIAHITKFKRWSQNLWPVIDYGKYGRFPNQYITMVFPKYLEEDVFFRSLNGELTEQKIKERFDANINK